MARHQIGRQKGGHQRWATKTLNPWNQAANPSAGKSSHGEDGNHRRNSR